MKQFILINWYKLITATSILLFACGFFVLAIKYNTAKAGSTPSINTNQVTNTWVVAKDNKFFEVTWDNYSRMYSCKEICD